MGTIFKRFRTTRINLGIILGLSFTGLCMAGCDDIAEKDRYIEMPATKVERTVLLEDFTGQNCVNCPAAHLKIEALEEQYGSHFVAVSIHAGIFGIPATSKRFIGLMQDEGNIFNDAYGIEEYPQGVLNGKLPALNDDKWAAAVYKEISEPTPLSISLDAALDSESKKIEIECELKSSETLDGNLMVWVTESGIHARQEDINLGRIPDYIHNNVFRACVNGIDGDRVELLAGEPLTKNFSIQAKETDTEKWNVENLYIVAFLKNKSGVVQAAKTKVSAILQKR